MRRYYPSEDERDRVRRAEEALGIRPAPGPTSDPDSSSEPEHAGEFRRPQGPGRTSSEFRRPDSDAGVARMPIAAWRTLWRDEPASWLREIRDRPARFDAQRWRRAVVEWRNDTPAAAASERPLHGVPVLVKDLFDVTAEITRCGSAVLGPDGIGAPAERDAWLVRLVRGYGVSLQGRTAMNEFAYGIDGRNRVTGDCPHPLDSSRISGGSSSGSAWAVAAGVVPLALGTDTGGSIRLPAAVCGIYGYRLPWHPSRLSGTFPLSPRMDTVGWFVASVEDVRRMLTLTTGTVAPHAEEADASDAEEADAPSRPTGTITIASLVPPEVSLDVEVRARWNEALAQLRGTEGLALEVLEAPQILGTEAWKAYNVIGSSDAAAVHAKWLDRYQSRYDPLVWSLIDRGRRWTPERIAAAEATRGEVARTIHQIVNTYDMLVMPVTPAASPTFEEADGDFREAVLRLNAPVSLAGLGALTVPLPHSATRSSGLQVVVSPGAEERVVELLRRLGW